MLKKLTTIKSLLTVILTAAILFLPTSAVFGATQAELDALKKQLSSTTNLKNMTASQVNDLVNQVNTVSSQISQTESAISQTQGQIASTSQTIADLEKKILEQQSNLDREQEKMSQVIASWYMEGDSGLLEAVIGADSLSQVMDRQQYYESLRQQIQANAEEIQKTKDELDRQKNEKNAQLQSLTGLKDDQVNQQNSLESKKSVKSRLLNNTASALSDLKAQETSLKAKIDEMTAQLNAAMNNGSGIRYQGGDVLPSIDSSWYQTQLRNYTIFNGTNPAYNITVNSYGCYITSIAMMASYYGHHVTNTEIASTLGTFSSDGYLQNPNGLANSLGISMGTMQLTDWGTINNELDSGHPIIVGVRLDNFRVHPNYVSGVGFDHFIVIKSRSGGKYYMHDPANGKGYRASDIIGFKTVRSL
jgi:peptidoglycan hydrolase CwlO-like protein